MPFTTLASGLTIQIPTPGTKNWAATLQAQCWQKISEHDHTGSGLGKQIGTNALAALAVTAAKIANATITATQLASDCVTTAKILDSNVTTAKIANSNVTFAKMQSLSAGVLLGRRNNGGGAVEEIAVTGGLAINLTNPTLELDTSGVTTTKIASGAVTAAKLDADAASRTTLIMQAYNVSIPEGVFAAAAMIRPTIITHGILKVPKGCKVTHVSVVADNAIQSGNWKIHVYKNGSSAGNFTYDSDYKSGALSATITCNAGDTLAVYIEGVSGDWSGGTTSTVLVDVWGHYYE